MPIGGGFLTLVLINMRRKNKKEEPALRVPQPVAHINKARERKTTGKERKKTHPPFFFSVLIYLGLRATAPSEVRRLYKTGTFSH